jgi:hypothetical protein
MGDPSAEAINRPNFYGATFLHQFAARILRDPDLLAYLVAHGPRLNATQLSGISWFEPGYHATWPRPDAAAGFVEAAALDRLSDAQLRELTAPVIAATGAVAERGAHQTGDVRNDHARLLRRWPAPRWQRADHTDLVHLGGTRQPAAADDLRSG